jgi:hypothetical protein
MVPVFGPGVVYDSPTEVMYEQLRFVRSSLALSQLRKSVSVIEKEALAYFERRWGDAGEVRLPPFCFFFIPSLFTSVSPLFRLSFASLSSLSPLFHLSFTSLSPLTSHLFFVQNFYPYLQVDLLNSMNNLTILTASRCLMGDDIRNHLGEDNEQIAHWYHDLEQGINPLSFFFPHLPLPGFKRRDQAREKVAALFRKIIAERRRTLSDDHEDIMSTLMSVCVLFILFFRLHSLLSSSFSSFVFILFFRLHSLLSSSFSSFVFSRSVLIQF